MVQVILSIDHMHITNTSNLCGCMLTLDLE
jgi:hypothetical protein